MRYFYFIFLLFAQALGASFISPLAPRRWDTVSIMFSGPETSELATTNPFTNFRLDVDITHAASGVTQKVPGFYAADGKAGISGRDSGNKWRVRFTPGRTGKYLFKATFLEGTWVAVGNDGKRGYFDGEEGHFSVKERGNVAEKDLRKKGRLEYVGQRYWRWSEGGYFLKLGTNSPENFLAYEGFDGVQEGMMVGFKSHVKDWSVGDVDWGGGKGKGIVGAVNYLSGMGVNSLFALLNSVEGDSRGGVHPWVESGKRDRYDVSKLEQWEMLFMHAERKGLGLNLAFVETENEALFESDSGLNLKEGFANTRKLYYREIVARFGHHLGLIFTLGEENGWDESDFNGGGFDWGVGNSHEQRVAFTDYIHKLDGYGVPIIVHTFPLLKEEVYGPMLGGKAGVEGAALQMSHRWSTAEETKEWISRAEKSGTMWVVTADEFGSDFQGSVPGVPTGVSKLDEGYRGAFAWGNLLSGGGGIELFSGWVDQSLDDFRLLETAWKEFGRAKDFVEGISFWGMNEANSSLERSGEGIVQGLAKGGDLYVVYVGSGVKVWVDLTEWKGSFDVRWFSPRMDDGVLEKGSVAKLEGGDVRWVGTAGRDTGQDWVVVVGRDVEKSVWGRGRKTVSKCSARDLVGKDVAFGVGNMNMRS